MLDPALLKDCLDDIRTRLERRGINLRTELELLTRLNAERRDILPLLETHTASQKGSGHQNCQGQE